MDLARKLDIERDFHDQAAEDVDLDSIPVHASFEAATSPEPAFIYGKMRDLAGKRVLDLGCGAGEASVYFALKGAVVTSLDISEGMCETTARLAEHHGVADNVSVVCSPVETAAFEDGSFDYVYGNGVLHHVDLAPTAKIVHRILAPGGVAFFIEPLAYNPAINVYRRLAEGVRTPTEQPLRTRDIRALADVFPGLEHREFQLMTLGIFAWMYFRERLHPSQVRYWKHIVEEAARYERAHRVLSSIDRAVLRLVPPLRWWCWNTVLTCPRPQATPAERMVSGPLPAGTSPPAGPSDASADVRSQRPA